MKNIRYTISVVVVLGFVLGGALQFVAANPGGVHCGMYCGMSQDCPDTSSDCDGVNDETACAGIVETGASGQAGTSSFLNCAGPATEDQKCQQAGGNLPCGNSARGWCVWIDGECFFQYNMNNNQVEPYQDCMDE
jgi:hypothetical protein